MTLRLLKTIFCILIFTDIAYSQVTIRVPQDQPTIQQGIDVAQGGDTVLVAPGTYTGSMNRDIDFNGKLIILVSEGGRDVTIIDCENNGRGFYFHSGEDTLAVVDGFTIRNASSAENGGAIHCVGSSPKILNCAITDNNAQRGGGIFCNNSSPIIDGCFFSGNRGYGAAIYCQASSPRLSNLVVTNNGTPHTGGVIYLSSYSSPEITSCQIMNNGGDGIWCYQFSHAQIKSCNIYGNTDDGVRITNNSSPSISNCLIYDNGISGIEVTTFASTDIFNCTIVNNHKNGIFSQASSVRVYNSIIYDNSDYQIYVWAPPALAFYASDVQNLESNGILGASINGGQNIDADPLFLDADQKDYRLSEGSPCLAAGNLDFAPRHDFANHRRPDPVGTQPDMGAYESAFLSQTQPANQAPILNAIGDRSIDVGDTLTINLLASDANNDSLVFGTTLVPSGGNLIGNVFTWTPSVDQVGNHSITFSVSDEQGETASETITISITTQSNVAPVLVSIGNKSVEVGAMLTLSLLATDADGDSLSFSTNLIPPGSLFYGNVFAWTPSADQIGDHSITFSVSDGQGETDSETILISIVAAPPNNLPDVTPPVVHLPVLSFPAGTNVNIGRVSQGHFATQVVAFANTGNVTLEVTGFIILDTQFSVGKTSLSVPPLTTKELPVTFTPHPDSTAKYSGFENIQARLFFSTNDANLATGVILLSAKGYVPIPDPQINVTVSRINLGNVVKVGSTGLTTFDVTNAGDTTLVVAKVEILNTAFLVTPVQATIGKGEKQGFEVLFKPTRSGEHNTKVTITSNDPEHPSIEIPVLAFAPENPFPAFYSEIASIDFGTVRTDSTKAWVIPIENRGQEPLRLAQIPRSDRVFRTQVDSLHIAPGDTGELHVTFYPNDAIAHSGLLQFLTNDPKHPKFEVSLSGMGKFPPGPRVSVFPESINFGAVILGQRKTAKVLLRNEGGQELRAVNLVTDNADFEISQTQVVVAPGDEYELEIEFHPTESDSVTGLLEIPNNDPSKPMVRVPLRAFVKVPAGLGRINPLVDQLTFSEIGLFGQTEINLPIRNDGVDTLTIYNVVSRDLQVAVTPVNAQIPPQSILVVRVRYRPRPGRAQTGELILNSNDATQPVVHIPWTASVHTISNALSVVSAFPFAGGFDVPVQTSVSLTFDTPLLVSGQYVALNARLIPQAESGPIVDRFVLEDSNQRVVFPVQLKPDTFYRLVVLSAAATSGATLDGGFELGFSTGQTAFDGGEITGRVTFVEDREFEGEVVVFDVQGRPVGRVPIESDGTYHVSELPAGSYRVFADVFAEGYGLISRGYDAGNDGIPDVIDLLVGQREVGVDVLVLLPGEPVPGSQNLGAKLRFDLDPTVGDQGLVELGQIGAGTDVILSVYAEGLKDVLGYSLKIHYDPDQVGFVRADGTQEGESNFLSSNGGQAVFITPSPIGGEVELTSAILGATEAVIPSGNGFLGQFRFVTREGFSAAFFDIAQTILQSGADRDTVFSTTRAMIQLGSLSQNGPGEPILGPIVLDVNPLTGNQGQTVRSGVRSGQVVEVQLFGDNLPDITGFGAHLLFDHKVLTYVDGSFVAGDLIPGGVPLVRDTGVFLDLGAASLQGASGAGNDLLGHLRFRIESAFSDSTHIRLTLIGLSLIGGAVEEQVVNVVVTLTADGNVPATGDIDGDGQVGFADFLMFARGFADGDTLFDLNGDGEVGFGDFLIFAQAFGTGG